MVDELVRTAGGSPVGVDAEADHPLCTNGHHMITSNYAGPGYVTGYVCDSCTGRSIAGHLGGTRDRLHCGGCEYDVCFQCLPRRVTPSHPAWTTHAVWALLCVGDYTGQMLAETNCTNTLQRQTAQIPKPITNKTNYETNKLQNKTSYETNKLQSKHN